MSDLLCFIIDNNKLFLEKVLVFFNEFPIYFLCVDKNDKYYIVLCSDMDKMEYMIVKQSMYNIWKMLTGRICMRDLMTDCKFFWKVTANGNINEDKVERINCNDMDLSVLPAKDAKYRIAEEDVSYVDEFTSKVLQKLSFDDINSPVIEAENSNLNIQCKFLNKNQYTNLGITKVDLKIIKEIRNENVFNEMIDYIFLNETYNHNIKKKIKAEDNNDNYTINSANYAA